MIEFKYVGPEMTSTGKKRLLKMTADLLEKGQTMNSNSGWSATVLMELCDKNGWSWELRKHVIAGRYVGWTIRRILDDTAPASS